VLIPTLTNLLANYDYNKGRRDEQKAVENVLEVLTIQRLIDPATLNLLIEELSKIDRRPRKEEK
jgi:hypothetical protein